MDPRRWDANRITVRIKGGEKEYIPITGPLRAILKSVEDQHPEYVFTYICQKTRHEPDRGIWRRCGERYPFTETGWRRAWNMACAAIGLPRLRFHDLRHTAATEALNLPGGSLQLVQEMLHHKHSSTTQRYAKVDLAQVAAMMERLGRGLTLVPSDEENSIDEKIAAAR